MSTIAIKPELAKAALRALVQHGTHEEFDYPGDGPESCGWWCDICNQHIDDDDRAQDHSASCVIEKLRSAIASARPTTAEGGQP